MGCGIGFGYLHRIPHHLTRETVSSPPQQTSEERSKKTISSALGITPVSGASETTQPHQQNPSEAASVPLSVPDSPAAATQMPAGPQIMTSNVPFSSVAYPQQSSGPPPTFVQAPSTSSAMFPPTVSQQHQQTITTPLNIPGMPPITVCAPVMMPAPTEVSSGAQWGASGSAAPPNTPAFYQPQQNFAGPSPPAMFSPTTTHAAPQIFNPVANSTPTADPSNNYIRIFDPTKAATS